MLTGAGSSPAGPLTPAGAAAPGLAALPAPPPDSIARAVDPAARDYSLDQLGRFSETTTTLQRAVLALGTEFGSSSVAPALGFARPAIIDASYESVLQSRIRSSLQRLTDVERVLAIDSIEVSRSRVPTGRVGALVRLRELATGTTQDVSI